LEVLVEIKEYVRIILKRGWIIAVLAVVTAASAIVFSKLQRPVYRATLYLNTIPMRLDWSVQQTIKNMMRNYGRQITSDQTLGRVNDLLQLDMPPDMLRPDITVDPIESDLLIQIAVDNYDPMLAKQIADTAADVFVADITKRMLDQDSRDRVDVFVSDYARPGALYKPKWKVNALAGAVLGGLLGLLVIFYLEWLEADIIRSAEDIERNLGLSIMGIVPSDASSSN
jgi:capsular polysaccharide biosynthesis protein